ncbi:MAG TPA: hypothetical protein VGP44_11700 [Gemmatimonadales bacterium]|nr:hypothetical protein [Gemmatimonadales bacterium]
MSGPAMAECPSCGKPGVVRGLMGGACQFCGDTARDRVAVRESERRPWLKGSEPFPQSEDHYGPKEEGP